MKANNKGQALIEFVLILPIALMMIFCVIDYSRVLYSKNHLESIANDVVSEYKLKGNLNNSEIIKENSLIYTISTDDIYTTITISQSIDLLTPFSSTIFNNPYEIRSERVFIYE